MSTDDFSKIWDPRIGAPAAETLNKSAGLLPYVLISSGITVCLFVAAATQRQIPTWLGVACIVSMLTTIILAIVNGWASSVRRLRAADQTFVYLGRPGAPKKKTFPVVMLRDRQRFDDYLVMYGIPQVGQYISTAQPSSYQWAEKHPEAALRPR